MCIRDRDEQTGQTSASRKIFLSEKKIIKYLFKNCIRRHFRIGKFVTSRSVDVKLRLNGRTVEAFEMYFYSKILKSRMVKWMDKVVSRRAVVN